MSNNSHTPFRPLSANADAAYRQTWKPLGLLNGYRLILAVLFTIVALADLEWRPLAERDPYLFTMVSLSYGLFALLCAVSIRARKPGFRWQLHLQILADIVCILALTYASGGIRSGLGTLLIVTLAGGGMLMSGKMAVLYAAISTLAVLGEESYMLISGAPPGPSFTHAGLLGGTFFLTAILAWLLAKRARESEALAAQRGVDLANMQQLTEYVIQRMQTGVIVVDAQQRIHLINESASHLLGSPTDPIQQTLADLAPELAGHLAQWQDNPDCETPLFRPNPASPGLLPRFAKLGQASQSGALIFLEDTTALAQHAQQLKLASLGRLTASIAHEIRNPLGAISHAGQLLAESPQLGASDLRLTEIIRDHSQRMNAIVENVLQLSRRQRARPEDLALKPWLEEFVLDFRRTHHIGADHIHIEIVPADTQVRMDPSQFHQIVWNLCHNGLRYSLARLGVPRLELRGGIGADALNPYLDIIDFGHGVPPEAEAHLFEPFFTTENTGTGLGLYLSRELCESNQARLHYIAMPGAGSCFRITFADPRRKHLT